MSFASASIPVGATFAPSGGSATTLSLLSAGSTASSFLLNDSAAFSLRRKFNASIIEPKPKDGTPSGYTQRRARLNIQVPIAVSLYVGQPYTTNSITIELSADITSVSTDIDTLKSLAMNAINDTDFSAFWQSNALG
jgi:hypothetical protein